MSDTDKRSETRQAMPRFAAEEHDKINIFGSMVADGIKAACRMTFYSMRRPLLGTFCHIATSYRQLCQGARTDDFSYRLTV